MNHFSPVEASVSRGGERLRHFRHKTDKAKYFYDAVLFLQVCLLFINYDTSYIPLQMFSLLSDNSNILKMGWDQCKINMIQNHRSFRPPALRKILYQEIISIIFHVLLFCTVSFSKDVFSQGAEYQVFLGVFLMFLAFFHSKIWAKFHFGTFKPYD